MSGIYHAQVNRCSRFWTGRERYPFRQPVTFRKRVLPVHGVRDEMVPVRFGSRVALPRVPTGPNARLDIDPQCIAAQKKKFGYGRFRGSDSA